MSVTNVSELNDAEISDVDWEADDDQDVEDYQVKYLGSKHTYSSGQFTKAPKPTKQSSAKNPMKSQKADLWTKEDVTGEKLVDRKGNIRDEIKMQNRNWRFQENMK